MNAFTWLRRAAAGLLLGGALLTVGCQSAPQKVPAAITTTISTEHRALPGTHVLLAAPAAFKLEADERLLRLDNTRFVRVLELPRVRFDDYVAGLRHDLDSLQEKLPADALQHTTFNGLPAIFLTQPYTRIPGLEAALLAFGDSSRVTLLVGVYPKLLPGARKVVQQILFTAGYDPSRLVAGDNLDLQLDLKDTGYQRAGQNGRWTMFLPTNEPVTDSLHATMFRVMLLPPVAARTSVQDMALALIRDYRNEADVSNVQESNMLMNGHYAYQNVLTFSHGGKPGQALVLLISTPQGLIVCEGRAYDKPYEHVRQFWFLAKSIRLTSPAAAPAAPQPVAGSGQPAA
jgi:hypothetical protein